MAKANGPGRKKEPEEPPRITGVTICGYKSIGRAQSMEIRPLTILAGANSSGKSSMMQPLLLLKQTLEAPYDPGPLLLNGPNVKFTSIEQMLSRCGKGGELALHIEIRDNRDETIAIEFARGASRRLELRRQTLTLNGSTAVLSPEMAEEDLKVYFRSVTEGQHCEVSRARCFLEIVMRMAPPNDHFTHPVWPFAGFDFSPLLESIIHLPGLRGNPERMYPVTAVGASFPGTFEKYTASAIASWAGEGQTERLARLGDDLRTLGLTWKVEASRVDDTQVELRVGRLPRPARGGARDLVNIADVGFGLSQALPVVTALHAAQPGQLVYLEQPEIHLHPRAQVAMAEVLAGAADRGVQVVIETHSSLLLLGVQTLVARGRLASDKVKLHWFLRNEVDGTTEIRTADLDEAGAFGDWPEDFSDVDLHAENNYLDAVEARPSSSRK
jgi:hypothetical protein